MAAKTRALISRRKEHFLLTLDELANAAGLHPDLVRRFVACGLIEPSESAGARPLFPASAEERLRRIIRLRRDLGANVAGVVVILEMREHIETLQRELRWLRRRLDLET